MTEKYMKKINKKGFTLVELLVTIVILGIITAMSLPLIRNLQEANQKRKFTTYSDSLENSAKLYVDSYSEDLFGHKDGGCAYITWKQLYEKDLTKDIQVEDMSCNSENSFVKVVKYKEHYNYYPSLGCGNKKNGEASKVTITLPDENKAQEINEESCGGPNSSSINISASPSGYSKTDRKKIGINVKITSPTGISTRKTISYAWSKTNAYSDSLDWKQLDISIPSENTQENQIISGKTIAVTSKQVVTPANQTGDYYLIIKIDTLSDLFGTPWNEGETDKKNYVTFGKYRIDNTVPIINSLKIESTTKNYNNINTKVTVNATDNNQLSQTSELKMCISTSENGCSSASNYTKYATTANFKVSNSFDGKEKTVYVSIKDMAGNIAKRSIKYKVYKECTLTKTDGKWKDKTICTVKCGGGTKKQESGSLDSNTGAKCTEKKTQTVACNKQECCGANKEIGSYGQWSACSKACDGGTRARDINYVSKFDKTISCGTDKGKDIGTCNSRECCGANKEAIDNGSWGACSKACGSGKKTRTITYASKFDHSISCGTASEEGTCNTQECCGTNKVVGSYGTWGSCSKKCGGGTRKRNINYVSKFDASISCGTTKNGDEGTCNSDPCTVKCTVSYEGTASGYNNNWYRSHSNVKLNIDTKGKVTSKGLVEGDEPSYNNKDSIKISKDQAKKVYTGAVTIEGGASATCSRSIGVDTVKPYICKYAKRGKSYPRFCGKRDDKLDGPDKKKTYKSAWGFAIKDDFSGLYDIAIEVCDYESDEGCTDEGHAPRGGAKMSNEGIWWQRTKGRYHITFHDLAGNQVFVKEDVKDANTTLYWECGAGISASATCH